MNTYQEVIGYLYTRLPMFTRDGSSAFKKDLTNTIQLCTALGNPQEKFKSVHIAGTNGKGSTSHMLAGILAGSGYKVGLYTSPHLLDFRERIRINGMMCDEQFVVDFVNQHRSLIENVAPSFFEITVAMAFEYFALHQVDVAIIEVGLGGRLDSTNIIHPLLSLITNIGLDHTDMLGDTLPLIAGEKAGIIKTDTPVVISERNPETEPVFIQKAAEMDAPIYFATDFYQANVVSQNDDVQTIEVHNITLGKTMQFELDLRGSYQAKNICGVLEAIDQLNTLGFEISENQVRQALKTIQTATGIQGRWQLLSKEPFTIADTGHNEDGIREVTTNLKNTHYDQLHVVIGAMRDKDLDHMLSQLPKDAVYYFAAPDSPRAMKAPDLFQLATTYGLHGKAYSSVEAAYQNAKNNYQAGDLIFVGGSNFVVAEILALFQ